MYQKVLIPVDGSEYAFKALDLAVDLAAKHNATIWLLHVVPSNEVPEGIKRWAEIEHVDAPAALYENTVGDNILTAAEDRASTRGAEKIEKCLEHGNAARSIIQVAQRIGADAIVMGSRGLSDFQGLLMGSVAHRVSHGAECTVVTVK